MWRGALGSVGSDRVMSDAVDGRLPAALSGWKVRTSALPKHGAMLYGASQDGGRAGPRAGDGQAPMVAPMEDIAVLDLD